MDGSHSSSIYSIHHGLQLLYLLAALMFLVSFGRTFPNDVSLPPALSLSLVFFLLKIRKNCKKWIKICTWRIKQNQLVLMWSVDCFAGVSGCMDFHGSRADSMIDQVVYESAFPSIRHSNNANFQGFLTVFTWFFLWRAVVKADHTFWLQFEDVPGFQQEHFGFSQCLLLVFLKSNSIHSNIESLLVPCECIS